MPEQKYNPYTEFLERAKRYGFKFEIDEERFVEGDSERFAVDFKTETNKEGYCLIGLMAHWKNTGRCHFYNYMLIEPRRPTIYFNVDENRQPIRTGE